MGRPQALAAVLRIVADPRPAAYYGCVLCGYTAKVRGREDVQAFTKTIRTDHRATCPALHPEGKTAA